MDKQTIALQNIDRAIQKAKCLREYSGETPYINSLNLDGCRALTLEQVKNEIVKGDPYHVKVWSKTEAEVKARISQITNSCKRY